MKINGKAGFTLIELMIVVAIIGILAAVALPAYQDYVVRAKTVEGLAVAAELKPSVKEYFKEFQRFPIDNAQAGIPSADKLIANYIKKIELEDGVLHITYGHKVGAMLDGQILSLRPAYVEGSLLSPISWLCGYSEPVPGMIAVGENKTTVDRKLLPASCRH